MAQVPSDYILVTVRITVRIQESEIGIHWIIDYAGVQQRSVLSEHF